MKFCILFVVFFISGLSLLHGQASVYGFVEGVNYKKNVVYKSVNGKNIIMDIFYPDADKMQEKNPWMVYVHGGGWAGGDKEAIFKTAFLGTLQKLIANGVVCATIDYRLAKSPVTTYESAVDCKDAGKFLLKNAALYNLDEENYGIWGGSAGGHLCLVTALAPDSSFQGDAALADIHPEYKCVASFYPLTSCLNPDLRPGSIFEDGSLFTRLLGGTVEEKPELARLLSPSEFLDENSPSILLLHGDKDPTLPIINSQYLLALATEKNADVELLTVKNAKHSFGGTNISPSFEGIADHCSNYILSHFEKRGAGVIQAEDYMTMSGFITSATTDEGTGDKISSSGADSWVAYETPLSGSFLIDCRVSAEVDADFIIHQNGEIIDTISFAATGGDEQWKTVQSTWPFQLSEGIDTIRITSNGAKWNLNWLEFIPFNETGTSINKASSHLNTLRLYPNPVRDILTIANADGARLKIYNSTGRMVLQEEIVSNNQAVVLNGLETGIYIVNAVNKDHMSTNKFIKR